MARIDQPGTRSRSAFLLSGVRHEGDSTFATLLGANATWARDSVAAVQVVGAFAVRPSPRSRWQLEGGASGAAFALSHLGRDGNGAGWLRVRHALMSNVGVLSGFAIGHTVRGSSTAHSVSGELGTWVTSGPLTVEVGAQRGRTEDSLLMAASRVFTRRRSAWLDMDDLALTVSWDAGPLDLSASNRWRAGVRGTDVNQAAFQGIATWIVTSRLAVVLTAGRQLADPVRGAPDAQTMTAVVRWSFNSSDTTERPKESDLSMTHISEGTILIVRIRAPVSARVEVAGSFSGWDPVPLTLKAGYWEAQVQVPPGRHRVAYRIDGGSWRAPSGTARLREFGGEVGLIVVPP